MNGWKNIAKTATARALITLLLVAMACSRTTAGRAQNTPNAESTPQTQAKPTPEIIPRNQWHREERPWGYFIWQKNQGNSTLRIMMEMGIKLPRTGGLSKGTDFYIPLAEPVHVKSMHGNISYSGWCRESSGMIEVYTPDGEYLDSLKIGLMNKDTANIPRYGQFPTPILVRGVHIGVYDDECKPVTWSVDLIFTY